MTSSNFFRVQMGVSEEEISQALEDQQAVFEALFAGGEEWENYKLEIHQRIVDQLDALPETQKEALGDLDAYAEMPFIRPRSHSLSLPGIGFFLTYDPCC